MPGLRGLHVVCCDSVLRDVGRSLERDTMGKSTHARASEQEIQSECTSGPMRRVMAGAKPTTEPLASARLTVQR